MQTVFVCGGRGTRLMPRPVGPKSLMRVGHSTLLEGLVTRLRQFHTSQLPPIVVVDEQDPETPKAACGLLPHAHVIRQVRPDGVASALLLAQPFLDDVVLVTLGDLFIDGTFAAITPRPALTFWSEAVTADTQNNFGIAASANGAVANVSEKPRDGRGLYCGMGLYVLTRSIVSGFQDAPIDSQTGERGITAALQAAIQSGIRFQAVPFSGFYRNVNTPADLFAIERHLYERVVPRHALSANR